MDEILDIETCTSVPSSADAQEIVTLQHQIDLLQKRVSELEQQRVSLISTQTLNAQMCQVLHPEHCIFHGPNTVDRSL